MAKYRKVVVKEGKYPQAFDKNGKVTHYEHVSKDRILKLASTAKRMKEKGLRIPAPWKHDKTVTAFTTGKSGLLPDSSSNAGFWDDLVTEVQPDGKLALVGVVDVPGSSEDINTPAGKVGSVVRDTSIYTRLNVPFTDDSNEVLDEAIMHIALVTHPIEIGQSNFELVDNNELCLVMSQMEPDDDNLVTGSDVEKTKTPSNSDLQSNSGSLSELINKLQSVCRLMVPSDTTEQTLVKYLSIAVDQYALLNSSDPSNPQVTTLQVEPLLMSHLDPAQVNALIEGKVVNPKTNKPYTKEDFGNVEQPKTDTKQALVMSALTNSLQSDRRKSYRSRIDSLVETGRTTKAFADTSLYPQADNYNLEFSQDQVVVPVIESLIMSLESMPAPEKQTGNSGYTGLEHGQNWNQESEADLKKAEETALAMARMV